MKALQTFLLSMLTFTIILSGCSQKPEIIPTIVSTSIENDIKNIEVPKEGALINESFDSKALSNTLIEQAAIGEICIYLPPSYNDSKKRYPVLYFLHGYGGSPSELLVASKLDEVFMQPDVKEFIVVGINGTTDLSGGSFYANSPVAGNWEDLVTQETVAYMDSHYRTISQSEGRGLVGFSMGGGAAINIGLKHPDIFSAIYAICPGVFTPDGLPKAFKSWETDSAFKSCYGGAFSPNVNGEAPYYSNIPSFDGTEKDNKIIKDWESGFGDIENKVANYKKLPTQLTAIGLIYGESDPYTWITEGTKYFDELLNKNNIPTEIKVGLGHSIPNTFIQETMIPFFSKHLKSE